MFWKFHLTSSGLDTLLSKEDVTLKEVLDEEDVLQECKTQNTKLIEFLARDEILSELLDMAISVPSEDSDLKTQFKYPNLACEVICSDIDAVVDKLVCEKSLLDKLWNFLDEVPPLNPLIASFFAKIIGTILMKRSVEVYESLREHDVVNKLLGHLEVSAIMEVFVKLISVVDTHEMRIKVENLLEEQELVQKLVKRLGPQFPHEMHCNASNLLSELVRMGRESPMQFNDPSEEPSGLCNVVDKESVLSDLIDTILSDRESPNAESSLVNGMDVLLSLIEYKRPNPEGLEELFTPISAEKMAQGVHSTLNALSPRLKDFHTLLMEPPPQNAMLTTVGTLDPPLGRVRLHVAWLLSAAVGTNTSHVNNELAELGTVNVLLDLFFKYQWNNFLHTFVEHCINSILTSEVGNENGNETNPLLSHLFCDCSLISKIVIAWEENDSQQSQNGGQRRGYMGHLTRIANNVAASLEKGPNNELLQSLFNELPDDLRTRWKELVEGSLNELNTKNATQMQFTSPMLHSSSEDDDDGTFKSVSILQYENSLQQVQPMSNEFIESFGHNEEELNQLGKTDNPFDEIGNVDFSINANDETPDAQLFEAVCNEKVHQFDDSGSDEECFGSSEWGDDFFDVWEEKELKFSPKTAMKRRQAESNSDESEESSDEASCSSDDEPVFADERKEIDSFSKENFDKKESNEIIENMEVEDWTANFDNGGVAMDTLDAAAVGWVTSDATATVPVEDESGFADFTDLSKFESDQDKKGNKVGPESPVAMDEDSNESFKDAAGKNIDKQETENNSKEDDKMDEDTPHPIKTDVENDNTNQRETEEKENASDKEKKERIDENELKDNEKKNKEKGKQNKTGSDVTVDVFDSGDDSMHVTSQVVGGFVVIDASATDDKPNPDSPGQNPDQDGGNPTHKEALSPSKGGVSVVTVSSRQVININSDGKVESPRSPRSPRSPKKSRSPTRVKATPPGKVTTKSSPKNLLEPDDILVETKSGQEQEESNEALELPTRNGPVNEDISSCSEKFDDLKNVEIVGETQGSSEISSCTS